MSRLGKGFPQDEFSPVPLRPGRLCGRIKRTNRPPQAAGHCVPAAHDPRSPRHRAGRPGGQSARPSRGRSARRPVRNGPPPPGRFPGPGRRRLRRLAAAPPPPGGSTPLRPPSTEPRRSAARRPLPGKRAAATAGGKGNGLNCGSRTTSLSLCPTGPPPAPAGAGEASRPAARRGEEEPAVRSRLAASRPAGGTAGPGGGSRPW